MSLSAADFFKLAVPLAGGGRWFVGAALEVRGEGAAAYFGRLSFTDRTGEAAIFPPCAARDMLAILRNTHPAAELAPATFEQWIEAPAAEDEQIRERGRP